MNKKICEHCKKEFETYLREAPLCPECNAKEKGHIKCVECGRWFDPNQSFCKHSPKDWCHLCFHRNTGLKICIRCKLPFTPPKGSEHYEYCNDCNIARHL